MSNQPNMSSPRSILAIRGAFWSAINIIVPTVMSLLVFVVTSRLLTPADFGVVAIAGAVAAAVAALVPAGFGDALVQRMEKAPIFLDSVFWLCICTGAALYLMLVMLSSYAAHLFHAPMLAIILPVLGLRILFDTAAVVPTALLTQDLSFHLIARRTLIATVASACVSVGLVLAGFGLWALVVSMLANSAISMVAMFWSTRWVPSLKFDLGGIRELAGYGAYATGTRILAYLGGQADQMVVGLVLGPTQLGFYYFARRIFSILNDVTSGALNAVAHPLFAGIQDDTARTRRGFLLATFFSSLVAVPIFVGLACVADRMVPLVFGIKWNEALWPIRILCAYGVISSVGILQGGLITSLGHAKWWFYYQLVTGLLNLPIIIFVSPYGTSALLFMIVAKAYLFWPISIAMTLRLLSLHVGTYLLQFVPTLISASAMAGVIILERQFLPPMPQFLALATDLIFGAATYTLVIIATSYRRIDDLALSTGVTAKIRRWRSSNESKALS